MKRLNLIVCVMLGIISCGKTDDPGVVLVDDDDAVEVAFEDVATDVKIVPLISDDPIGGCRRMLCYGNEVFIADNSGEYVYYFVDGKLVSTLHAVGRGPGEYSTVSHFAYSAKKKELWIATVGNIDDILNISTMMVMKYSVPDMKYKGRVSVDGLVSSILCQDGDKILTLGSPLKLSDLTEESIDTCRIILSDAETGETICKLNDVSYYDYMQSEILVAHGANMSNNICVCGYVNSLYHYEGDKAEKAFEFTFGDKNIPEKFFDLGQPTAEALMGILQYMLSEEAHGCLEGGIYPRVDGNRYSFWYHQALSAPYDHFFSYENGESVNYYGFVPKGMNGSILPKTVSDDGYVAVVEGDPESMFDDSGERSEFSAELEKTMKAQHLNNPVLIFYNIK